MFRHPLYVLGALLVFLCLPLWHETVEGRFLLEPQHPVFVRSLVAGAITQVYAAEGMRVTAGAPLFRMSNLPLESNVSRTNADYAASGMRATSALLHYSNVGTAVQDRERLAEQSRTLGAQAASLDVASPISGVVLTPRLSDRLGSYVPEGTQLAEIADLNTMRARMYVSEYELHRLKLGSPARLMMDGSVRKWNSVVSSLAPRSSAMDPALSEATKFKGLRVPNYYVVDMDVENPGALKPGMVGVARIYGSRRSAAGLLWAEVKRGVVRKLW
jgi:multidrug resistance efflux pump